MSTPPDVLTRQRAPQALAEVLGTPGRIVGFLVAAGVVAFFYTLLLPFDYTQRFELANWDYLNAYLLVWAIALGLAMGLVLSVQVHAMRRIAAARAATGAVGGVAFVASLLPSFLCCTPIIPSVLAFVGMSGVGLYTTTGTLQHFFAVHQTEFLSASLVLLALMCWWGLRKVASAQCLTEDGCAVATTPDGVSGVVPDGCCSDDEPPQVRGGRADAAAPTSDAGPARGSGRREGALR
ncbi:MAG TPA: hypothetical protein VKY90_10400 [Candidatus Dormibacteraeota bacterium]|nr:hypothetical protein [Candidatus Dormibacteraeota bacterium]